MKLRVTQAQWLPFVQQLCSRRDVETAGIILAEKLYGGEVLLVRELIAAPSEAYEIRQADQIRLSPLWLNRIIRPARDSGLSIFTVHTHPGTNRPWFSAADDIGDSRLMPSLHSQTPGPHGSLVIAGETGIPAARVWLESGIRANLELCVVGEHLSLSPDTSLLSEDNPWFDRQRLALGRDGQSVLKRLHVAVVGLGGTGSIVFAQLAHLGVGRITVIDGDRVEESNVSRVFGATSQDAGIAWKVDVAARYVDRLGLGTQLTVIRDHLGMQTKPTNIEDCDIVISCVDRHKPRALLNRLSYEKAVPVIDMGSAFRVSGNGKLQSGVGRVVVIGPGRRCLACWGHIDSDRIRIESLSPEDRAKEAADGYIDGADVPQPSVIAFNTMIAGAAVVELLRLATGFAGTSDPPNRLAFDFVDGTVRRNSLAGTSECTICTIGSAADERMDCFTAANILLRSKNGSR
jgi:hypothetical protein